MEFLVGAKSGAWFAARARRSDLAERKPTDRSGERSCSGGPSSRYILAHPGAFVKSISAESDVIIRFMFPRTQPESPLPAGGDAPDPVLARLLAKSVIGISCRARTFSPIRATNTMYRSETHRIRP
jgi:hypothetical protein